MRYSTVQMLSITIIISILICCNNGKSHRALNAIQDVDDIYYEIYGDEVADSNSYLTDLYQYYSDALLEKANYYLELFEWFRSNYEQIPSKSSIIQQKNDLYQSTKYKHSPRGRVKKKSVSTNGYRGYDNNNNNNGFASKLVDYAMMNKGGGVSVKKKPTKVKTKDKTAKLKPFSKVEYEAQIQAFQKIANDAFETLGKPVVESVEVFPDGPISEKEEAETLDTCIKDFRLSIGNEKYNNIHSRLDTLSPLMRKHTQSIDEEQTTTLVIFQRHCTSRQNAYTIYPARDSMPTYHGSLQLLEAKNNAGPAIQKALENKHRWGHVLHQEFTTHMSPLSRATLTALILEQTIIEQIVKSGDWKKVRIWAKIKEQVFRQQFNQFDHYSIQSGLQEDGGLPSKQGPKFRQAVKRLIEARAEKDLTKHNKMMKVAQDAFTAWLDNKWPERAADASSWWKGTKTIGKVLKTVKKKFHKNHGFVDLEKHIPDVLYEFIALGGTNVDSMKATEAYWQNFNEMFRKMWANEPKAKLIKVASGEGQKGRKNWLLSLKGDHEDVVFGGGHSNSLRRMYVGDATKNPPWKPLATPSARKAYLDYTKSIDANKPNNEKIPNSAIVMFEVNKDGIIIDFTKIWEPSQITGL
eukprot:329161_1